MSAPVDDDTFPVRGAQHFAVIPTWVLDADISAQAVRLYGVLRRYADAASFAWPKRSTLAGRLKAHDVKVVDRAVDELVAIGALEVVARYDATGSQLSNGYVVHAVPHKGEGRESPSPLASQDAQPHGGGASTPLQERDKTSSQASLERSARPDSRPIPDGGSRVPALVGYYVDGFRAANGGRTPPGSTLARLGKGIKELVTEGQWAEDEIKAGLTRLLDRNIDVGLLASTVMQVVAKHRDRSAIQPVTVATDTSQWNTEQCDQVLGPDPRKLSAYYSCEHDVTDPEQKRAHATCLDRARSARLAARRLEAATHLANHPVPA